MQPVDKFSQAEIEQAVARVIRLIEYFEGLRLRPYLCPAGVWTIGLGSTKYLDGRRVGPRDPAITREHAYLLARHQIMTEYLPAVIELCPGIETADQLAAITDFAYNLGVGALRASTLRQRINRGPRSDVRGQLLRWVQGGGRVLRGLVRRRRVEATMFEG